MAEGEGKIMSKAADAFRTIGEVADELDVPKHVLRFWEGKFPQIRPMKRGGGRRYYRPEDMELLRGIRHLLHAEGYTIKGVQKILREQGVEQVKSLVRAALDAARAGGGKKGHGARGAGKADGAGLAHGKAAIARPSTLSPGAAAQMSAGKSRADAITGIVRELELCRAMLAGPKVAEAKAEVKRVRAGGRS